MGQWLPFESPHGRIHAWRTDPEGVPRGALVVVQEIFGVNPHIRTVAEGFACEGYVVLAPDIAYTVGQPGRSALDAVLPAIDALVKKGGIDEKNIGIQGHSWGGYQIAWMVTKTNRFKAAGAGAPAR